MGSTDILIKRVAELEATILQMHKDYGCEIRDPMGTIWEHADRVQKRNAELEAENKRLVALLKKCATCLRSLGCEPSVEVKEAIAGNNTSVVQDPQAHNADVVPNDTPAAHNKHDECSVQNKPATCADCPDKSKRPYSRPCQECRYD